VELVYERSEGNAFLVEEVVEAVQGGADPDELLVIAAACVACAAAVAAVPRSRAAAFASTVA
jgi:hypothetical protein